MVAVCLLRLSYRVSTDKVVRVITYHDNLFYTNFFARSYAAIWGRDLSWKWHSNDISKFDVNTQSEHK